MISLNEFGMPVSNHVCASCGQSFTVCPPASDSFGDGCLAEGCASYDVARDADLFFATDPDIRRTPGDERP